MSFDNATDLPIVSVIIPTHNRANLIRETLDCVLAQSYSKLDIIVVDDGSTDDTAKILDEYEDVVRFYRLNGNFGGPCARNLGFRESIGNYVQFLDSDDLLDPKKIEIQIKYLAGFTDRIAYGPWARFTSDSMGNPVIETIQQVKSLEANEDILKKRI